MTPRDLMQQLVQARKAAGLTQNDMVSLFNGLDTKMSQGDLSRMERRDNMLVSSLILYAECIGYELRVVKI